MGGRRTKKDPQLENKRSHTKFEVAAVPKSLGVVAPRFVSSVLVLVCVSKQPSLPGPRTMRGLVGPSPGQRPTKAGKIVVCIMMVCAKIQQTQFFKGLDASRHRGGGVGPARRNLLRRRTFRRRQPTRKQPRKRKDPTRKRRRRRNIYRKRLLTYIF